MPQSEGIALNDRPKCQSEITRIAAFEALLALCKDNTRNEEELMVNWLMPLREHIQKPEKFGFSPKSDAKSSAGFVGLKNLGNICYLNSVMQQFYHIPEVAKAFWLLKFHRKLVWMKERALRT